jgi:hypothetical protein
MERIAFLLRMLELPDSILGLVAGSPHKLLIWFTSFLHADPGTIP